MKEIDDIKKLIFQSQSPKSSKNDKHPILVVYYKKVLYCYYFILSLFLQALNIVICKIFRKGASRRSSNAGSSRRGLWYDN